MPTLGVINTKKVILPSSTPDDEAWVVVKTNIPAKDAVSADEDLGEEATKAQKSWAMVAKVVVEWNFLDATGNPAPVTPENVSLLPSSDFIEIIKQAGLTEDLSTQKKTNSSDSSQAKA